MGNSECIGNSGHRIPPSPGKNEHSEYTNKYLDINLLFKNLKWFKKSVFNGSLYLSVPLCSDTLTKLLPNTHLISKMEGFLEQLVMPM